MSSIFGGGSERQTVTEKSEPWAAAQPYLKDIFKLAQEQQRQFMPTAFPGQTFAPLDPLQEAAQRMMMQYATGSGQLPQMQLPQNMPEFAPSMAPQGSHPLFQQEQAVPQASVGSPVPRPAAPQEPQGPQFGGRNFNIPLGFGLPF